MARLRSGRLVMVATLAIALVAAACSDSNDSNESSGSAELPECLTFEDLYALNGPEAEGVDNWADAQELATELGSTTEFPDAELSITAPGEESGTYGSYIEIALQDIAEARLEEGAITEEQVETTRKDYNISADDNVIIDAAAGTDNSFGWVGFAFADQNSDSVREFAIDGGEGCVSPSPETIADFSYPLSRPLFIYVDKAKAKSDPAVAAFVNFYMSDAGRLFGEEADYVSLTAEQWAEVQAEWEALGIAASSGDVSGSITISGSSTVEPITAIAAEAFSTESSGVSISVSGPGTSDGFAQFCAGEIPISDASREIKDEEAAVCADAGIEFIALQVAIDGLSVITKR